MTKGSPVKRARAEAQGFSKKSRHRRKQRERRLFGHGNMMLPEPALGELAAEGIVFRVKGAATYEQFLASLRNPAATAV
jgi:hypothetical protein